MNTELELLASRFSLSSPQTRSLALAFGLACAKRVEHLLEEQDVVECLQVLESFVSGKSAPEALAAAASKAGDLANRHRGSRSIDGCGHAAVSATYGVYHALAGKALQAASYCAYAAVYASGGYAAVAEPQAFEPEFRWQASCLEALAARHGATSRLPAEGDASGPLVSAHASSGA